MLDGDIIRVLASSATNYRRGLFCPAELWRQIACHLVGRDAEALLGNLPPDLQEVLRRAYRERPWSLLPEFGDEEGGQVVEHWCLLLL